MNVISKLLTAASAVALLATPLAASAQSFHAGWGGPGWHEHWRGWDWGWRSRVYVYPRRVYYGAPIVYAPPVMEAPYYGPPAPVVYERPAPPVYHRVYHTVRVVHHTTVRHAAHHATACVSPHTATHHA
jgi:hypothetical protein